MEFDYRKSIRNEYEERKARNSSYSLRAYARDLQISSTALHGVLGGKRQLSEQNLEKVARRLGWSPQQMDCAQQMISGRVVETAASEIFDHDRFRFIADWFYLPLLNLPKLPFHSADPKWIAKRLGLKLSVAKEALERLVRLNYLEVESGRLVRKIGRIGTTEDVTDAAKLTYHTQVLDKAREQYDRVEPKKREYLSVTLPVNSEDLEDFKTEIRLFREKFMKRASANQANEVYQLNLQFFPVTEEGESSKVATKSKKSKKSPSGSLESV